MNRKQNLEVFAKTPVRKAVLLQIVPAVASQMVTLVYNLADTYFVGLLNDPLQTAAVSVAYIVAQNIRLIFLLTCRSWRIPMSRWFVRGRNQFSTWD